jgi:hypothetical protein
MARVRLEDTQGVAAHESEAFKALAMEVGGVTIVAATIEHIMWITAAELRRSRDDVPPQRDRRIEQLRADLRVVTAGDPAEGVAVDGWLTKAANLLNRRDRMVHVLWQEAPDDPEGALGTHVNSNERVNLARARKLVDDLRAHVRAAEVVLAGPYGRALADRLAGLPPAYRLPPRPGG